MATYDVLVIGAGQAGLAMGYELRRLGLRFILLEAGHAVGASWRRRYDSLKLFTPARHNGLRGLPFPGEPDRFPGKDGVADYLQHYAVHFNLPITLNQQVQRLTKEEGVYTVYTQNGKYKARQVVVSTGAFHTAFIPALAQNLNPLIQQLHSSQYRNERQLKPGKVLVVGGGNSGVQLAEELLAAGREVSFSLRDELRGMPNSPLMMRLLFASGLVHLGKYSWLGRRLHRQPERIIGTDLKKLFSHPGLVRVGAVTAARDGSVWCGGTMLEDVESILWCTGYRSDFSWIELPVLDEAGQPMHRRGVTPVPGLYFLGLPWLHSRSSGLLGGVARDAAFLAGKVRQRLLSV